MKNLFVILVLGLTACQIHAQSQLENTAKDSETLKEYSIQGYEAHWLTSDVIVINNKYTADSLLLTTKNQLNKSFPLFKRDMPEMLQGQYPHLAHFNAYSLDIPLQQIKALLKQPLVVVEREATKGKTLGTFVQIGHIIDEVYTSKGQDANEVNDLGATLLDRSTRFKLWAPTAQNVSLLLFERDKQPAKTHKIPMVEDNNSGVWQVTVPEELSSTYYRYQVTVYHSVSGQVETIQTTDPYSLSLSMDSEYSQVIDLQQPNTFPSGWMEQKDVPLMAPEDNVLYETHIRDFSAHDLSLSDPLYRGKYAAFTDKKSDGFKYLQGLAKAGVNSIHLLPTFDIGSVGENTDQVIDIDDPIEKACNIAKHLPFCTTLPSEKMSIRGYLEQLSAEDSSRESLISAMRTFDNYNWGYDPFHFTVPEGSYALQPEGKSRIVEFRAMVQQLHNMGFRVIMDVVYNHSHQAGLGPKSVLDRIVPGYYHRLDPITGLITQSSCCDNTATERVMMEKLMIDSLVVWARDYKIDGFRFDLMAHQPKSAMLKARKAVREVDPDTYFYGEGWNFGEVANNKRFVQASQLNMAGTEIGTFTDRLRDAVRGGSVTNSAANLRKNQGIGNGLGVIPNELQNEGLDAYYLKMDQLRIGLAGNLANFPLMTRSGKLKLGQEVPYGEQPTGYALDPADTINYVSKHDNQTLWDNNQYRVAYHLSPQQRTLMQVQNLSFVLLAQGIPFIHMGSEMLRSKGFLRDSYDYGDWFNKVDFSLKTNNYNIGLPPKEKDQVNWPLIKTLLKQNQGRDLVSSENIRFSVQGFLDLLTIRMTSALYRLTNEADVIEKVKFHNTGSNQQLGLIVMSIAGDAKHPGQLVLFNTSEHPQSFQLPKFHQYALHPVLASSANFAAKKSYVNSGIFTVAPLTTAVFIKPSERQVQ